MKNKRLLRSVSLMILVIILFSALSCSEKKDKVQGQSSKITDESDVKQTAKPTEKIPDERFVGKTFYPELTLLVRDNKDVAREWHLEAPQDELDESVLLRKKEIQEELSISLKYELIPWNNTEAGRLELNDKIIEDVTLGEHKYDVVMNDSQNASALFVRDCYADMLDDKLFPYFDFRADGWCDSYIANARIGDSLYNVTGDMNFTLFDNAVAIWCNETIYRSFKEKSDPYNNFMQIAIDGNWTYEEMLRWITIMQGRYSGDKFHDASKTYSFGADSDISSTLIADVFPHAWGINTVTRGEGASLDIDPITKNGVADTLVDKIKALYSGKRTSNNATVIDFARGRTFFFVSKIKTGNSKNMEIREMEDRYGILPLPKYDASQTEYMTPVISGYTVMSVLDHSKSEVKTRGEEISAYFELSTERSHSFVRGYYCNRIIKPKLFGSSESTYPTFEMWYKALYTIIDSIEIRAEDIYHQQIGDLDSIWRDAVLGEDDSVADLYEKCRVDYEQRLNELNFWLTSK